MYFVVALFIALMVIIGLAIHINEQRKYIKFLLITLNGLKANLCTPDDYCRPDAKYGVYPPEERIYPNNWGTWNGPMNGGDNNDVS